MASEPAASNHDSSAASHPEPGERRRRRRACVHWSAHFTRAAGQSPLATITENISSEGLYCLFDEALAPGDKLECRLEVPRLSPDQPDDLVLCCRTVVVHVEALADRFGVGFRIEHYSVLRPGNPLADWISAAPGAPNTGWPRMNRNLANSPNLSTVTWKSGWRFALS